VISAPRRQHRDKRAARVSAAGLGLQQLTLAADALALQRSASTRGNRARADALHG
jgi:hypothetical protein